MTAHDSELADIEDWLAQIGSATWGGRGWDVTSADERLDAALWFQAAMDSFESFQLERSAPYVADLIYRNLTAGYRDDKPQRWAPPTKADHESQMFSRGEITKLARTTGWHDDEAFYRALTWARS